MKLKNLFQIFLAVVMMAMFAPATQAQAQNYKLDGDYVKFMKYVKLNPDEAEQYVETTEAEEGETVTASIDPDKIPQGKYFTGVYTSQDVTLTTDWDGATFTMPAKNVTVNAELAAQEDYTIDLTSSTSAVIPMEISTLLSYMEVGGQTCSVYDKDYNWFLDLNVDGTPDLEVKSTFDQTIQDHIFSIEVLSGSGVYKTSCSFALNTPTPDQYKSLIFKFKEVVPVVTLQSGWITLSSVSFTYDGTEHKPTVTVNDGTADITRYFDIKYENNTNAGEATAANAPTVTVTANAEGYTGSVSKTFTIKPKALTITADGATKVYDGQPLTKNSYTSTELASGDAIKSVTVTGSQTDAGTSANVPSGAVIKNTAQEDVTDNYAITYANGTLTVTKASLNITAEGYSGVYDGTAHGITVKNVPEGLTVKYSEDNTNFGSSELKYTNICEKTIYWKVDNDNYDLTSGASGSAKVTITPKPIKVKAENKSKMFGEDDPSLTYTADALIGEDQFSGSLVRDEGETPGNYRINKGTLSAGGNYKIIFIIGTFTINAQPNPEPEPTPTPEPEPTPTPNPEPEPEPEPQPEPDPVTENVIETNTETVTNLDGSTTTIVTSKETDSSGKLVKESNTSTTNFLDGSKKVSESKTPETDGKAYYFYLNEDGTEIGIDLGVSGSNSFSVLNLVRQILDNLINRNLQGSGGSDAQPDILIAQGNESNVLVNKETEIDPQGEVTATSASLTVKQTGDSDPTQIAICAGGGVNPDAPTSGKCGGYMTWVVSANAGSSVYDVLTISGSGEMEDMIEGSPWDAYQNQIKTVIIGEGVTSIGYSAFYRLMSLASDIILPASVTSIGNRAFASVSENTTVGISITAAAGSRLTAIGRKAFSSANASIDLSNCSKLEAIGSNLVFSQVSGDVTLPSSVTSICQYAFENENSEPYPGNHVYITVPDGKKLKVMIAGVTDPVELEPTNGKVDIIGCLFADPSNRIASRALTLEIVDASTGGEGGGDNGGGSENPDAPTSGTFGNLTWEVSKSDANSTVYDVLTISGSGKMNNGSPWSAYKKQIKTVIFESVINEKGVMEGVTSIGNEAFFDFSSLTSVTIPAGVTSIGIRAFKGCSSLTSVTIPAGVTSIGSSAFSGCSSLTSVTIPAGVTSIGGMAFFGCSAMTSLTFAEGSQLQTIGYSAFCGLMSLASDITLPAGVTSMGQNAFERVSKNTTVGISITAAAGSQLTAIDTYAFNGANASIDLSNCTQLEAIGSDLVFNQVTGDVTLPSSVTSICQYAFGNERAYPYPGNHVYITVPSGKKLKVTIEGVTDPVEITPTNGKADIIDCLFANRAKRIASRALTLEIVDASTGDDNGGGSASGQGQEPSTQDSKSQAKSTMTVNFETKKVNDGGDGWLAPVFGRSVVTAGRDHLAGPVKLRNSYADSRAASAEEEEEDDEIEIVSGKEYELLHDGYIVLNFYTPDAPITVNSIVFRRPGDANNDGYVDAADLVEMINAKAGKASERFNLANADIDRDGKITQNDIDAVVKMIME